MIKTIFFQKTLSDRIYEYVEKLTDCHRSRERSGYPLVAELLTKFYHVKFYKNPFSSSKVE